MIGSSTWISSTQEKFRVSILLKGKWMIDLVDKKMNSRSRRCLNFSRVNLIRQYPTYGNVTHEKSRRQIYRNYLFFILNLPALSWKQFLSTTREISSCFRRISTRVSCHRQLQHSFGYFFILYFYYFSYVSLDPAGFENEEKFQDIQRDAFLGRIKSVKKKNYMNVGTYVRILCVST